MLIEIESRKKEILENFGARLNDINYSRFMHGLKLAGIELDRKILADLAMNEPESFAKLVQSAKEALNK